MLVTIENQLTTEKINDLVEEDTLIDGPARIVAVGGQRRHPLPHPFGHLVLEVNGDPGDSAVEPVHPRDLRMREPYYLPHESGEILNIMVNQGKITLGFAVQAGVQDQEEIALSTI